MKRIWRELAFWAGGFAARNGRFDRYGGFAWPVGCRSPPPTGSLHSALSLEAVGVDGGVIADENGAVQRASAESDFCQRALRW